MSGFIPKWHKELGIFNEIKPIIIIEGNVLDKYQYPVEGSTPKGSILQLQDYLHYFFKDGGYENIVFYDSLKGFTNTCEDGYIEKFAKLTETKVKSGAVPAEFKDKEGAPALVRTILTQNTEASVVIMNYASRYITSPDHLEQEDVDSYTLLLQASMDGKDVRTEEHGMLKNVLVMIVNKVNDLPVWFYLNNPNVKIITLNTPTKEEREELIKGERFRSFFANDIYKEDILAYEGKEDELEKIKNKFVALTDGFSFTQINGLRLLCKNERFNIKDMSNAIDLYRYGISENPWNNLDVSQFRNGEAEFQKRVKGQDYAITKTLDVVKRSITGMSGLQHSSHSKPRGILFFAGPTGTGKTETAKTLAEKLFGDESNCIRFDMSEYSQSHSDQKLLGAPPGYVGYESGGQLTNAIKENPFTILLFDEIEKAHPSIFDKFLQILEDGRMTDGQGNTIFFTETIIIFTSNLGIYTKDANGQRKENVNSNMDYTEIQTKVRSAIEDYFKLELGRPEILNRIGENVVVFDFIRRDVASLILDSQLEKIVKNLMMEKQITLEFSDSARETLLTQALGNLNNGARGIGNIVESCLINPLSRYLFDHEIFDNARVKIAKVNTDAMPVTIECEV